MVASCLTFSYTRLLCHLFISKKPMFVIQIHQENFCHQAVPYLRVSFIVLYFVHVCIMYIYNGYYLCVTLIVQYLVVCFYGLKKQSLVDADLPVPCRNQFKLPSICVNSFLERLNRKSHILLNRGVTWISLQSLLVPRQNKILMS